MDKIRKEILRAYIHIALTETSIFIIKIELNKSIPKEETLEIIGYTMQVFNENILKVNKHYNSFNHEFKFGGPTDENWDRSDLRDARTIKLYSR